MTHSVSERAFEDAVEAALLRHGPDERPAVPSAVAETPPPHGDPDMRPGGYRRRRPEALSRGYEGVHPHPVSRYASEVMRHGSSTVAVTPWPKLPGIARQPVVRMGVLGATAGSRARIGWGRFSGGLAAGDGVAETFEEPFDSRHPLPDIRNPRFQDREPPVMGREPGILGREP